MAHSEENNAGGAPAKPEPFTFADMNFRQKTKHILANVTVEPITLMYVVANTLSGFTTQFLNLEKACRVNLNYTTELCDEFSKRNITEETEPMFSEVSTVVADMQVWQTQVQSSIPIILVLFVGSWADRRHRRKPFLIAPIIGDFLMVIGLLLCSVFYLSWPLEVAGVIESIFPAMFGGLPIMIMSIFSYIADVTTVENRTFRIGMVATAVSWGVPVASALSGVAFLALGFSGIYIVSIVLYGLILAYGVLYIREPQPPVPRPPGVSFLGDFFNWHHVWETIKVALKKRAGSRRLQFYIIVLLYFMIQGPLQGESAVSYLYLTVQFQWDAIKLSAYITYFIIVLAAGNFVVTTVLSRWMKLDDSTIGIIAMVAKTLAAPLFAFCTEDWQFYAVTLLDMVGAGAIIALRAIATKLVDNNELGKLMALLAVVEAVVPLVFKPIYSKVYSATNLTHPNAFFHISGVVSLVGIGLYSAIFVLRKRDLMREAGDTKKDDDEVAGGVANAAFQGDTELRARSNNSNGVDNTFL